MLPVSVVVCVTVLKKFMSPLKNKQLMISNQESCSAHV